MKWYLEVVTERVWGDEEVHRDTYLVALSDNYDEAKRITETAQEQWRSAETIKVEVGEINPLVLDSFDSADVKELRLVPADDTILK